MPRHLDPDYPLDCGHCLHLEAWERDADRPNAEDLAAAEEDDELRRRHTFEGALVIVGQG